MNAPVAEASFIMRAAPLGAWVVNFVNPCEAGGLYMRIYFRGADIRMTQKKLHRAQIGPALQKVRGKGVTDGVRGNGPPYPGGQSVFLYEFPNGHPA